MPVARSCSPGDIAVDLKVSEDEYLMYVIRQAGANVQYILTDNTGRVLFDNENCPPCCCRKWPTPDTTLQPGDEDQHVLAMQFIDESSLEYRVERCAASGNLIACIKNCKFKNTGPPDDFFEGLRIFLS